MALAGGQVPTKVCNKLNSRPLVNGTGQMQAAKRVASGEWRVVLGEHLARLLGQTVAGLADASGCDALTTPIGTNRCLSDHGAMAVGRTALSPESRHLNGRGGDHWPINDPATFDVATLTSFSVWPYGANFRDSAGEIRVSVT